MIIASGQLADFVACHGTVADLGNGTVAIDRRGAGDAPSGDRRDLWFAAR